MAKQTNSVDTLAAEILASLRSPSAPVASSATPLLDVVADSAGGMLNGLTRIGGALRAAGTTSIAHYKLERGDQIDRAEVALAARAKQVAERMIARRQ